MKKEIKETIDEYRFENSGSIYRYDYNERCYLFYGEKCHYTDEQLEKMKNSKIECPDAKWRREYS